MASPAPGDTRLRERLDGVDPRPLRPRYQTLFSALQRGKRLEGFSCLDGRYRRSLDGTGDFSSPRSHGAQCCEQHHRNGTVTYYHQMLGAVLVHPDHQEVFPLAPEPILKPDRAKKNDGERHAAKRLLEALRREHPHLKLIVIEDGLAANAPHIRQLKTLDRRFILGATPDDHPCLFEWVAQTPTTAAYPVTDEDGTRHRFRYRNGVPLNDANCDLEVIFLAYGETQPNGQVTHCSWVTDCQIDKTNLMTLMRGARARWQIANATVNTLKNPGDYFGRPCGHGHQHLSTVLMPRMMLALLIDPIQQRTYRLFQSAVKAADGKTRFWRLLRNGFDIGRIPDGETRYRSISRQPASPPARWSATRREAAP
ncbi:MAG: hypothetical protein WAT36_08015 [Chromatiaceae bacterium]